jgi:transposase
MPVPYRYNRSVRESPQVLPACVATLFHKIKGEVTVDTGLLNLEDWRLISAIETEHDIIIYAVPLAEPEQCSHCGAPASKLQRWGYTKLAFLYDSPIRSKRTRLYYRSHRFRCQKILEDGEKCGRTTQQPLQSVNVDQGATNRLIQYIQMEAFRPTRTNLSLSEETGVPESTIRNIFTDRAVELESQRVLKTPRWLAIDEVNIPKKVYKHACCVLSAPLDNSFTEILEDNKQETLVRALLRIPDRDRVEVVSIDFWSPYVGPVVHVLKNAVIVIDRRHSQAMVLRAFKAFIQDLREKKGKKWCKVNMLDPTLLFKRFYELLDSEKEGQKISEKEFVELWLERVPELKIGYWLKEDFCNLYDLSSSEEALQRYDDWEIRARAASPAFDSVAQTVKLWRHRVFKYNDFKDTFPIRVTNGPAEALNRIIKRVRRLCVRLDFYTLRAKLVLGECFVRRRPVHPLDPLPGRQKTTKSNTKSNKRKSHKKPGPNANTERLRRAFEARDKTKGLIQSPMAKDEYAKRFENLRKHGLCLNGETNEESMQVNQQVRKAEQSNIRSSLIANKASPTDKVEFRQLEMFQS